MKFHITHKTEIAISLRQNIGLWKQIALAITFGLATAILIGFFHLWSSDLIYRFIERLSCFYVSYFSSHKTIATDAYTYAMSYEDFGKIRV